MKALTQALLAVATAGLAMLSPYAAGAPADFDGGGRSDVLWRNPSTGENYAYLMNGVSIAGEGYLRTIADQNWQVVYGSPWPEEMGLMGFAPAGAQTLLDEPVRYTAASVNVQQALLSDTALSSVATFYGLNGTVEFGSFESLALEQRAANTLPLNVEASRQTLQPSADTTAAQDADATLQLAAHADGDWVIASKDDKPAARKAYKVDWKSVLSKFGMPFLSKDKAPAKASQSNFVEFKRK